MRKFREAQFPGTVEFYPGEVPDSDLRELIAGLRDAGHAVNTDHTVDDLGKSCGDRIFHALTCRVCQKDKMDKINEDLIKNLETRLEIINQRQNEIASDHANNLGIIHAAIKALAAKMEPKDRKLKREPQKR